MIGEQQYGVVQTELDRCDVCFESVSSDRSRCETVSERREQVEV